jgi:hypothetical protein
MDDTVIIRYDSTELRIPQERAMEFLQLLIPPMLRDPNSPEARSHGAELAIIKGILGMPGINGLLTRMLGKEALTPPKGTDKLLWLINWLGAGVITQAAKQDLVIEVHDSMPKQAKRKLYMRLWGFLPSPSVHRRQASVSGADVGGDSAGGVSPAPSTMSRRPAVHLSVDIGPGAHYRLGDHTTIAGMTGVGKTTFLLRLIEVLGDSYPTSNLYILDSKHAGDFKSYGEYVNKSAKAPASTTGAGRDTDMEPTNGRSGTVRQVADGNPESSKACACGCGRVSVYWWYKWQELPAWVSTAT